MYCALSQIMKKEKRPSNSALCCILRSLLLIQYPSNSIINLDRMTSYLEKARNECIQFYSYPTLINETCDMFESEIKEIFYSI